MSEGRPVSSDSMRGVFRGLVRRRTAALSLGVLCILYAGALGADVLAPYAFDEEARDYSYCPPTPIRIFDVEGRLHRPFVYGLRLTFDRWHRRIYRTDTSVRYPVRLFPEVRPYKLWGWIPARRKLLGVEPPGRLYLIGADARGRDLFSRLLYGGRVSLSIGLIGTAISFTLGLLLGGIAGYYGGRVDEALMRVCEMIMMVPGFYLLLALRAAVPADFNSIQVYFSIVVILSFIGWAGLARIIRGMCLSLKTREYVLAAKVMGVSDLRIIVRHILPQTLSYSLIAVMLTIPGYILGETGLSLLGLGIVDPYASWGNMLSDAMSVVAVRFAPWILAPGVLIFATVMAFNVIGDALRDILDPHFGVEEGA